MKAIRKLRAMPHFSGRRIDLDWNLPAAAAFDGGPALTGIRIVRRARSFPADPDDGDVVYDGGVVSHFSDRDLEPLVTYYYAVYSTDAVGDRHFDPMHSRATGFSTEHYGLAERTYGLLPAVHQRLDTPLSQPDLDELDPGARARLRELPAEIRGRGQLRRYFQAIGAPLDAMRSFAEGLPSLHDSDRAPPDFLVPLAGWLDWQSDRSLDVFARRNEIKFAPHLYREVGTVPSLRSIVNRYTGWYTQVAELEQQIARSNRPPALAIHAIVEEGGSWRGSDDAAPVLGFTGASREANGAGGTPAVLVGGSSEPFSLRPDMELAVTVDDRIPTAVRFRPGDFDDLANATAAEVAAVLDAAFSELTAKESAGSIELTSHTTGPTSAIRVETHAASLVTLESAPRGRLAAFRDGDDRLRVFYTQHDPDFPALEREAARVRQGLPSAKGLGPGEMPPVRVSAAPLLGFGPEHASATRTKDAAPTLVGTAREPFALSGEMALLVTTNGRFAQTVRFRLRDFVDPDRIPAAELARYLDGQLVGIEASALPDGRLRLAAAGKELIDSLRVEQYVPTQPGPSPETLPPSSLGRLRYKTLRAGAWGESHPVSPAPEAAEGDPAAAERADRSIFLAWAESPGAATTRLRFRLGRRRGPRPARLVGERSEPFRIAPGSHLVLRGAWTGDEGFEFAAGDFANPSAATAAEVAAALSARLARVTVSALPNGTIAIETPGAGGDALLEVDLRHSSAAAALGFAEGNRGARGEWDDEIDWSPAADVPGVSLGRHTDLFALAEPGGAVRLFWSRHEGFTWQVQTARWDGTSWSAVETPSDPAGRHHREPCAALDAAGRVWLIWSQSEPLASSVDGWRLRQRVFDPVAGSWLAPADVTTPLAGQSHADREPGVVPLGGGDLRVFFQSTRNGGRDLWDVRITPSSGAVTAPTPVTSGGASDHAPAPVLTADGSQWLLFRSDRSVSLSRIATRNLPEVDKRVTSPPARPELPVGPSRSVRMPDTGTLRRLAGATSVALGDAARLGRRARWDDLLCYTPQQPAGPQPGGIEYTRGAVGLFLSRVSEAALPEHKVARLRRVLDRFKPIHVRPAVVFAPRVDIEYVYTATADLTDAYRDEHPDIEYYAGLADSSAAVLPDWSVLVSNSPTDVSADPTDLLTLRRRTFFLPPS